MSIFDKFANEDISVIVSELLVATADSSDPLLDGSINAVLKTLRERMRMDAVFVSEIVDGKRVFRFVDANAAAPKIMPGDSNPVEETYCQRVIDGRMPGLAADVSQLEGWAVPVLAMRIGAYLSTPLTLKDGRTYGTLCCFSEAPNPKLRDADLTMLRQCATLVARKLELSQARGVQRTPAEWAVDPRGSLRAA